MVEEQILSTLQDIRGYLFAGVAIFGVFVFLLGYETVARVLADFRKKAAARNDFLTQANKLFDSGQYNVLVDFCRNRIGRNARDHKASWWLGKALYASERYGEAKTVFEKLGIVIPEWRVNYITPYLEAIDKIESSSAAPSVAEEGSG
jgi:hypothetical protein